MKHIMWDLPDDTYLSHVSKGRLRLKISSKKRDSAFFAQLQAVLTALPGLDQVKANPLSGSLLILHSELPEEMASFVKTLAGFAPKRNSNGKPNTIYRRVTGTFHQVNTQIQGFTKGELDVPTLSFIALVAVGLYQISRKNFVAPAWYMAFWYALNIFLKSKE
ncbi:MAG: HMA2 domain-containing protein [Thermodesulfobacteriota bacterium]